MTSMLVVTRLCEALHRQLVAHPLVDAIPRDALVYNAVLGTIPLYVLIASMLRAALAE